MFIVFENQFRAMPLGKVKMVWCGYIYLYKTSKIGTDSLSLLAMN